MLARYAKSYIDQLYEARDITMLHGVVSVVGKQRQLPEEFSIFLRLWDWCCSTRSGIWQYYECLAAGDASEFKSLAEGLDRFGLSDVAARFRPGMTTWQEPNRCDELDAWIDSHWKELEAKTFQLISANREFLYGDKI